MTLELSIPWILAILSLCSLGLIFLVRLFWGSSRTDIKAGNGQGEDPRRQRCEILDQAEDPENAKAILRNQILLEAFSRDFASSHDQLDYVLTQALEITGSAYGYLYLYDEDKKLLTLENWIREGQTVMNSADQKRTYRGDRMGPWSQVLQSKKPMIINALSHEGVVSKTPDGNVFRLLTIPILIDEVIVGVAGLANKPKDYDDADVHQFSLLMTGVWNAKMRRERTLELKESKEKLELILDSVAEGIFGMDEEGRFTFVNASCLKIFGYSSPEPLIGKSVHDLIHHTRPDQSAFSAQDCPLLRPMRTGEVILTQESTFLRADGSFFPAQFSVHPQCREGKIIGAVVTFLDITDRKKAEENLNYLSRHDVLTGLYNRAHFESILPEVDQPENLPLSIIVGDVNGLKLSNDIFGHAAGDDLLQRCAEILQRVAKPQDLLFRIGGDEFYLLLKNTSEEEAHRRMESIRQAMAGETFQCGKGSISLGSDTKDRISESFYDVLSRADEAMYQEKVLGKEKTTKAQLDFLRQWYRSLPGVEEHALAVADLAASLGQKLYLSHEEQLRLKEAAFYHGIGKIAIRGDGRKAKSSLTGWKEHPVIGYRILHAFEETLDLADLVLSQGENWDGSGYPKGLSQSAIPLLARVISASKAYVDALVPEYDVEKARKALLDARGKELDPYLVDLLLDTLSLNPLHTG